MAFVGFLIRRSIHDSPKGKFIKIGDVRVALKEPQRPELVPLGHADRNPPPQVVQALKWLLQKDALKQDVFLIGVPGPLRSSVVFSYLELCQREFEYLSVNRDTTEADIKQRREIVGGSAYYSDLCAVRAALNGRVLVIDGVEKAERNVLPILNNLLENREMQLDDGRFLMAANKYDKLKEKYSEEELKKMKLERVSERFHVIALGLPVPTFKGHTLDPPLRSRFQCKNMTELSFETMSQLCTFFAPNIARDRLNSLLAVVYGLNSQNQDEVSVHLPVFPVDSLIRASRIWNLNPEYTEQAIFNLCYPKNTILKPDNELPVLEQFFTKFETEKERFMKAAVKNVKMQDSKADVEIKNNGKSLSVQVPAGGLEQLPRQHEFVSTPAHETLLADLMTTHGVTDFCLLGPRGSGKTTIMEEFARKLGYEVEAIVLYQDMNSRELLQQRRMLPNGDTVWDDSQLVTAAKKGSLCVLDGLEKVHWSTAEMLAPLIYHRYLQLPDGTRLIGALNYEMVKEKTGFTDEQLAEKKVFKIADSFRIVALGDSSSSESSKWLNEQIQSLFVFHSLQRLSASEQSEVVFKLVPDADKKVVKKLINLTDKLSASSDASVRSIAASLSLRRLLYIIRRHAKNPDEGIFEAVNRAALSRFMPSVTKSAFFKSLEEVGILPDSKTTKQQDDWRERLISSYKASTEAANESMIPDIVFFDNKQHQKVMNDMAKDFELGSHLLVIGNQGVGKNKITDRFLQLIRRPRQYMQLHRDTTVQSLTVQTTVIDGVLKHEDSPLVKAVKDGLVLVVDEADKAPAHVVAILKSLLDSGVLYLADGRKIQPRGRPGDSNTIQIHPDFRLIMLANRPGFPFLGNDLFAVLGDLFSVHVVDNPSRLSELAMLKQYGPNVADEQLNQLVAVFDELREMADNSMLTYPYSTRELVNIVKHLQVYPDDPLTGVVRNVFDFDSFTKETTETVEQIFQKHGIPLGIRHPKDAIFLAKRFPLAEARLLGPWGVKMNARPLEIEAKVYPLESEQSTTYSKSMGVLESDSPRSRGFTEEQQFWQLPTNDVNVCSDILSLKDKVIVATVNPPTVYVVNETNKKQVQQYDLTNAFSKVTRGEFRPRFKLGRWSDNEVLVHEETTNTLFLLNLDSNTLDRLNTEGEQPDFFESLGRLSPTPLMNDNAFWRLVDHPKRPVLFERNGKEIRVLHPGQLPAGVQVLKLPDDCPIAHVSVIDKDKFLINSSTCNHLLTLESDGKCLLRQVDESMEIPIYFDEVLAFGADSGSGGQQKKAGALLSNEQYYGLKSDGFPDTLASGELKGWRRTEEGEVVDKTLPYRTTFERNKLVHPQKEVLMTSDGLIIRAVNKYQTPLKALPKGVSPTAITGFMEVVDTNHGTVQYIPVPFSRPALYHGSWVAAISRTGFLMAKSEDEKKVFTVQMSGTIRAFQVDESALMASLKSWNKLFGDVDGEERIEFERPENQLDMSKLTEPTPGKFDPDNTPHVGGNMWMGGTGGYNTAGLGGVGGPFRLDAGHNVHQISETAKERVPEEYKMKAREINRQEYLKRLKEIEMSEHDANQYETFMNKVKRQVTHLKGVIDSLEAREHERQWVKHQTSGDLDDGKLIEGMTGEKGIYRRRMDLPPEVGTVLTKPKRVKLVFDVSGSMYRFNSHDQRLQRSLEAALMAMQSFEGKQDKVKYDISGHSGDGPDHAFTDPLKPPKNEKDKFDVLKKMFLQSQFCVSGDFTLEGLSDAISKVAKETDVDEKFVILLSDANLDRYGIHPKHLTAILDSDPHVHAFVIFVGSLGPQANKLVAALPAGKAFYAQDTSQLPNIIQSIFASTLIK